MLKRRNILDLALTEVSKMFISIKNEDFRKSLEVFDAILCEQVKKKMKTQSNFFDRYGTQVLIGGSVADGTKVSKLNEVDMDIVIRLPINTEEGPDGITIENDQPGYVKMKILNAFDYLDKQQHWESRHKVTRDWRDSDKYFLQNKFRNWLQGIVQRVINDMGRQAEVNGVKYILTYKESGPAYTLQIRNAVGNEPFALDVDLVPVIKFKSPRWPTGYRQVNDFKAKEWFVVPKPNKCVPDSVLKNRCWRLSFQEFENELIKGCLALKSTIRLVKKLRDALGMKALVSYYIKTLFLWKVSKNDKVYWRNKLSVIFRDMIHELYDAIHKGNIPYFWQEKNNLIGHLKPTLLAAYAVKLKKVLHAIAEYNVERVVASLLTSEEYMQLTESDFYQKHLRTRVGLESGISFNLPEQVILMGDEIESQRHQRNDDDKYRLLKIKVHALSDRMANIEDRRERMKLKMLEGRLDMIKSKKEDLSLADVELCIDADADIVSNLETGKHYLTETTFN